MLTLPLLFACVHGAPKGDTGHETATDIDTGGVDLAAIRANVGARLDCGTPPTMVLDEVAFLSVLDRPKWFSTRWTLLDGNIQSVAGSFAAMFPEEDCLVFSEPDYSGFSGSCVDVEGWTVSGSKFNWSDGTAFGGTWSDLVIVEPWPYPEWQISGTGHWEAEYIGGDPEAFRCDIDRQWTNVGANGGADNGTFSIVASGEYGTAMGVFAGLFSSLDDWQSRESEDPRAPLPDGSTCFARAGVTVDGSWFGWDAVLGDHLWEQESTVDADGDRCTRIYADGDVVDDACP